MKATEEYFQQCFTVYYAVQGCYVWILLVALYCVIIPLRAIEQCFREVMVLNTL